MRFPSVAFLLLLSAPIAGSAETLTITVTGLRDAKGSVRAAIYDNEAGFLNLPQARAQAMAKAAAGDVAIAVENLPPGRYAVAVFHDANDNGKLDRNALNIPTEGYGFSNDARGNFGPPKFGAAAFAFDAQSKAIAVAIDY